MVDGGQEICLRNCEKYLKRFNLFGFQKIYQHKFESNMYMYHIMKFILFFVSYSLVFASVLCKKASLSLKNYKEFIEKYDVQKHEKLSNVVMLKFGEIIDQFTKKKYYNECT